MHSSFESIARSALLSSLALGALGCALDLQDGHFACTTNSECPSGWVCRAERCYRSQGALDGGDAAIADGGGDAGGDAGCVAPDDREWFPDCDGDGYAPLEAASQGVQQCDPPEPSAECAGWTLVRPITSMPSTMDCNDQASGEHPSSTEIPADGIDQDCDGAELCFADADLDGYRPTSEATVASADLDCDDDGEADGTLPATDCDDARAETNPMASESCNSIDDDCDTSTDENVLTTYYQDVDSDGYGAPSPTMLACTMPSGFVAMAGDCNDSNAAIYDGATEVCNGVDDNCRSGADDGFTCRLGATQSCIECGFNGTQSCGSECTWGACRGFTFSRIYDDNVATAFTHACGSDCSGDWCLTGAPLAGCEIISGGPGLTLPPGAYEVDFYFGDSGTYDFSVLNGTSVIATQTFTNVSGAFPHVVVPFRVMGCGNIGVKVFGHPGARIRIYSVAFRRTAD